MAKSYLPARVAFVPECLYESAPDSLRKTGALMYFHSWLPATLEDPADSEAVHTEALVPPESKPYYSFGGGNILDSP